MNITLDTGADLSARVSQRLEAKGFTFAHVTVSEREARGSSFHEATKTSSTIQESAVWDEGEWGVGIWGGPMESECFEKALTIISSGAFPKSGAREHLSGAQKHQLRDAMILCAHVREGRDVLVSNDARAFINHGRREQLQSAFGVRIMTPAEFVAMFDSDETT